MADLQTISVEQHRGRILALVPRLEAEPVPLAEALGRTLAADADAALDLPPWDNSAMDGYAVRATDTTDAAPERPVYLRVIAELPAGTAEDPPLTPGQAATIMTGAPMPTGADAVVPVENVLGWDPAAPTAGIEVPEQIGLTAPTRSGRHVRRRAEDVAAGQPVARAGEQLSAHRLAALAAAGNGSTLVARRPRVAVVATGSELVAPGEPVRRGQIPDSNGLLLSALLRGSGAEVTAVHRATDDPDELARVLAATSTTSDAVVLAGGASVGAHDVARLVLAPHAPGGVPRAPDPDAGPADHRAATDAAGRAPAEHHGPEDDTVRFERLALQPGKPQGFGLLGDGRPAWSLPGNPVSVWVSYLLFVEPGLLAMQGRTVTVPPWRPVTTAEGWLSPAGREQYVPVRTVSAPGESERIAQATGRGSGSHLAGRLARATGIAQVAAEVTEIHPGDTLFYRALEDR